MHSKNKQLVNDHTHIPNDVFTAEKKHLGIDDDKDIVGLALSGGGIRSASFGLGFMQALVSNNQLERVDYLSTVSGGGYLGSALTWALKQGGKNAGVKIDNFPLGKKGMPGRKNAQEENSASADSDNKLLDFIRQHGSYLTPTKNLDIISFSGVVLRGMLMSLSVYLGFITIFLTASLWLIYTAANGPLHEFANSIASMCGEDAASTARGVMLAVGVGFFLIILFFGFVYSLTTYFDGDRSSRLRYANFIWGQKWIGILLKLGATSLAFGSLPYVVMLFQERVLPTIATASVSSIFGTAVGIWQYIKARKKEETSGTFSSLLVYAGAFALFYGIILLSYVIATHFFLDSTNLHNFSHLNYFFILFGLTIIFGYFVNLNFLGPHYVWRSRLMEAFMPNKEAVNHNQWKPASEADGALMEDMCDKYNPRPYHIINTNVILSNSSKIDFSGRGGDNFIISPLYCGSDATGWKTTKTFQKNNTRGMTLASAMAASAAALNPNAAVSGEGVTRNLVVSILLSMLNLRLGYWTSNPRKSNKFGSPNFISPGLTQEIFREGLHENTSNLLLSDGGHYENLGLYELIRRKMKLIILSDGGADPNFNFDDLANAIEKVRVDFGANIKFKENFRPDDIIPGSAGDSLFQKQYKISNRGFAIADIFYNDGNSGTLVYVKLAMIEGLPTDVYSYKGVYPSFPHQSTSDQFFDEKQFEAYRELGNKVGWQMMESTEGKILFPEKKG